MELETCIVNVLYENIVLEVNKNDVQFLAYRINHIELQTRVILQSMAHQIKRVKSIDFDQYSST